MYKLLFYCCDKIYFDVIGFVFDGNYFDGIVLIFYLQQTNTHNEWLDNLFFDFLLILNLLIIFLEFNVGCNLDVHILDFKNKRI